MATRKAKASFAIKRFKAFWNQFRRSKRGIIGIGIVAFFTAVAIFAPLIAHYDPIEPKKDIGEYPRLGEFDGPPIAAKLCSPVWYTGIPWVYRGQTQLEESFWANVTEVGTGYVTVVPQYGHLEEAAVDDYMRLRKTAVEIPQVEITFPNDTSRKLVFSEEYNWETRNPTFVKIQESFVLLLHRTLGEDLRYTAFKVTYSTATDITKNIEVVPEFKFSSDPFGDGEWRSWTNHEECISITYNTTKGYYDGCIEITYNPSPSGNNSEKVKATVWTQFEYPYWEPPQAFWGHLSVFAEGTETTNVDLTITTQRENSVLEPMVKLTQNAKEAVEEAKRNYESYFWSSTDNVRVWPTVGSQSPEKVLFPVPGNYTYGIEVVFNGNESTSVYLDNFNLLIYGNSFGLLGTDNNLGYPRDIFSTLVYGTRVSLIVGILSAVFGTVIGLFLGLTAGYMGGITDEIIMRTADLFLVLPTLPLFIILVVALKQVYGSVSMWNIIIVLTLFGWMGFARSIRSMVLSLRERPFIEAAKAAGAKKFYIINKHVLPNVFALVYITLATAVPGAIITEASLSWLGLGDPMLASWGKLLYDFQSAGVVITRGITDYWFWMFPACIAIALLATAFILIGYALDEILNPRLRQRR